MGTSKSGFVIVVQASLESLHQHRDRERLQSLSCVLSAFVEEDACRHSKGDLNMFETSKLRVGVFRVDVMVPNKIVSKSERGCSTSEDQMLPARSLPRLPKQYEEHQSRLEARKNVTTQGYKLAPCIRLLG